jgi:hypothetical protein
MDTSAPFPCDGPACPVSGLIVEEVEAELDRVAPTDLRIRVDWCGNRHGAPIA